MSNAEEEVEVAQGRRSWFACWTTY